MLNLPLQEANQSLRDELDSIYSVGLQQQKNFDYHGAGGEEGREKQHDF
jgi:hypothetical protein